MTVQPKASVIFAVALASLAFVYAQSSGSMPAPGLIAETERLRETMCPVGSISAYVGKADALPRQWRVCDGSEYDPKKYPLLERAIGTAFDTDHRGRWKLPKLDGVFLRGGTPGSFGGKETMMTSPAGRHQHGVTPIDLDHPPAGAHHGNRWFGDDDPDNQYRNTEEPNHHHDVTVIPPFAGVTYVIRVE